MEHSEEIPCLCSSDKKAHLCNKICRLNENSREGCLKKCKFSICEKHENCYCDNPIEKHICNKICSLRYLSFEETCHIYCNKIAGHKDECKCSSEIHRCNEPCKYKDGSRKGYCKEKCFKELGHEGIHLCGNLIEEHKCKHNCYLKYISRLKYNHFCEKIALHEGEHLCNTPKNEHKCNYKCYYLYCSEKCDKIAGHDNKEPHYCRFGHKCQEFCYLF